MAFAYSLHKCARGVGEGEFYLDCARERHPVFLSAAVPQPSLCHGIMNNLSSLHVHLLAVPSMLLP